MPVAEVRRLARACAARELRLRSVVSLACKARSFITSPITWPLTTRMRSTSRHVQLGVHLALDVVILAQVELALESLGRVELPRPPATATRARNRLSDM